MPEARPDTPATFEGVKARLDEIVAAVGDDGLPLDEALALYEEAVSLGLRASDLLEQNIEVSRQDGELADAASEAGPAPAAPAPRAAGASPTDS